jgi:hypothetical protein
MSDILRVLDTTYMRYFVAYVRLSAEELTIGPVPVPKVILWWELRRIVYNVSLLIVGMAAVIAFEFIMNECIPKGEDAEEPMGLLLGILLYAICANAAYTLGWIMELRARRVDPVAARAVAQRTFVVGYLFSCALTTAPFWFACIFCAIHGRVPHPPLE